MTELQTLSRFIKLNRQALKLLDDEYQSKRSAIKKRIEEAENRAVLLRMLQRMEKQTIGDFNAEVSRRIDCVRYLIENP